MQLKHDFIFLKKIKKLGNFHFLGNSWENSRKCTIYNNIISEDNTSYGALIRKSKTQKMPRNIKKVRQFAVNKIIKQRQPFWVWYIKIENKNNNNNITHAYIIIP